MCSKTKPQIWGLCMQVFWCNLNIEYDIVRFPERMCLVHILSIFKLAETIDGYENVIVEILYWVRRALLTDRLPYPVWRQAPQSARSAALDPTLA